MGEDGDEALLSRVSSGDEQAMRALYERHQSAIRAFAFTRLRDEAQAADILHDVMIEVWRQADRFSGRSSVRTWLFTIARNKAVDRLRKSARMDLGDDGLDLVADGPTPEEAMAAAQDRDRVRRCMAKLPEAQRAAIHLAFFDMLPYPEIADIEDVPVGTIKTRIFHAKKALAACLTRGEDQSA